MTGAPLLAQVQRVVRDEIRDAFATRVPQCAHELPPPVAIDEERVILGALLAGHVGLVDLVPLQPDDCFLPLHAGILRGLDALDATGRAPTVPLVIIALRALGIGGTDERLAEELHVLVEDAPAILDLGRCVAAVIETARRRRLADFLRDLAAEVRAGTTSVDSAIERLRIAMGKRTT